MAGKVRNLVNRSGRYHARLVVPKDLRGIIGKTDMIALHDRGDPLHVTLLTKEPTEAIQREAAGMIAENGA